MAENRAMAENRMVVAGRLDPDGTLHVDEKLAMPPGPVQVTIETARHGNGKDMWAVLKRIWAEQGQRSGRRRSKEEIDAEINAIRNESETEIQDIERLRSEARRNGE